MNTYLPSNFDCEVHISNNPYKDYNFRNFDEDHANYLLGLIETIPAKNKDINDKRDKNGGYTPMCAALMQSYVQEYKKYLAYFEDTGVIKCDKKHIANTFKYGEAKCCGYKFTDEYQGVEVIAHKFSTSFEMILTRRLKKEHLKLKKDLGHLTKWLGPDCKLKVNKLAIPYIKLKQQAQLKNPDLRDEEVDRRSGKTYKKDPVNQYNCALQSIYRINNKDIYLSKDDTVNRFHTNLTNIKSELRNLITYDNELLYSVDITCSQPYLTLALFNPRIERLIKDSPLLKKNLYILKKFWSLQDNEDVKRFKSLVSKNLQNNSDFYTYIQEESRLYGMDYKDRSKVKTGVFEVLFSKNTNSSKSKKMFKTLFPTVNKLYTDLKNQEHETLACLLQQIESCIILQVITKKIAAKYPKAPLFTIHDSIITTEPYRDYVHSVMEKELTKLTGCLPKLKVEQWTPEELDWNKYR